MIKIEPNETLRVSWRFLLPYAVIFVAVPILTFIIGKWVDATLSLPSFPPFPANLCIGAAIFFFGLAIGIKSTRTLYRIGRGLPWGEMSKQSRSTRLVTSGPYAYCRNPMTLGYSLLPCGMGVMFRSIGMTIFVPAIVFAIMIGWLKVKEEPNLEKRFGEAYREYKRRTPFLIPHTRPITLNLIVSILGFPFNEKRESVRLRVLSLAYVATSLFSLGLLTVLTFKTPTSPTNLSLHKQLIVSAFGLICLLGALAATSPSKCSQILHFKKDRNKGYYTLHRRTPKKATAQFRGHHPMCGNFSSHVFEFRGKKYCAGCSGLLVGAAAALAGILLYYFGGLHVLETGAYVFWLGFMGVACGLLQHVISAKSGVVHFFLNVVFVFGAFLILVTVNDVNGDFLTGLYFLAVVVYWLVSRISLSQIEHKRICGFCRLKSCIYHVR
ncbi:MAG: isoprenylcysteine carboxylmethyltransferase family protein [Candidatus Bathyarchaeota archaeon]|nr:isoprenylcysteine carboxylmethyltransferase family protein [Candidatus Bathyarchaeota archaeon]